MSNSRNQLVRRAAPTAAAILVIVAAPFALPGASSAAQTAPAARDPMTTARATISASYETTRVCRVGTLIDSRMGVLRTQGPVTVTMPYTTASHIARAIGPGEFGTPTTANSIPCDVAQYVANETLDAQVASSRGVTIDGQWTGEAGAYNLGRFACTPNHPSLPYRDSCTHAASRAAGRVTVTFEVASNVD